jgi:flagellar motor switch protein FliN/FliY
MEQPNTPSPAGAIGLGPSARGGQDAVPLEMLRDVSLPVIVEVGRTEATVQEVLRLGIGSVVTLDRAVGEPVDLFVSDRLMARGEVVVVAGKLGVRVTALAEPERDGAEA